MEAKKRWLAAAGGFGVGLLNGLLGAGGGMLAVPLLSAMGTDGKRAHATSLAVIVPLSAASAVFYLAAGRLRLADALPYLPGGALGALAGGWLLPRLPTGWLRLAFSGLLLWGGLRLLLR